MGIESIKLNKNVILRRPSGSYLESEYDLNKFPMPQKESIFNKGGIPKIPSAVVEFKEKSHDRDKIHNKIEKIQDKQNTQK